MLYVGFKDPAPAAAGATISDEVQKFEIIILTMHLKQLSRLASQEWGYEVTNVRYTTTPALRATPSLREGDYFIADKIPRNDKFIQKNIHKFADYAMNKKYSEQRLYFLLHDILDFF